MNELQIFNNAEFGQVRTTEINGQPYFVGNDVANALGYSVPKDAVSRHCKGAIKQRYLTEGGQQELKIIPESDLYRLIIKSKLPSAEKFEKWVMEEVLPSIRKNGGYIAGQETMSEDELIAKALLVAHNKIAEKDRLLAKKQEQIKQMEQDVLDMDKTISEMKPKVNYVDRILASKATMLVTQIAQDYGMSAKKFNKMLNQLGIQHKVGRQWILYGKYQGNGYVHSHTFEFERSNGLQDVNVNTEWTQKGRLFLYEELKKNGIYPCIEQMQQ